jgi:hypothetical protein
VAIGDHVSRVRRRCLRGRFDDIEQGEQHSVGAQHSNQLACQRLDSRFVEVIEDVPTEDAVHRAVFLCESLREKRLQRVQLSLAEMTLDIAEDVFDVNLATKLLAEKIDVGADDGTEVDQPGLRPGVEAGKKLRESFGWVRGGVGTRVSSGCLVLPLSGKQI